MAEAIDPTNVIAGPLAVAAAEYWREGTRFRLGVFFAAITPANDAFERLCLAQACGLWPRAVADRFGRRAEAMLSELRQLADQGHSL